MFGSDSQISNDAKSGLNGLDNFNYMKELAMDKVEYKNKKIEFEESSSPNISIDGETIQISKDADANAFNAAELPYGSFNSVKELAEAIVEKRLQHQQ